MTIPHAVYFGLVLMVKFMYPSWVTNLCVSSFAPLFIKFFYPLASTVVVLHHSRNFVSESKTRKGRHRNVDGNYNDKAKGKSRRRRRSSIGALIHGKTPGSDLGTVGEDMYTEEDFNIDVKYWLNFWIISSVLKATYTLATKTMFISTVATHPTVHCIICQLDFLFYIWLFCLPECLLILFPSAGEEERRDWNKSKQWLYEVAIQPVSAIPTVFLPVIVPCFEKVSQAVSPAEWKRYVVDKLSTALNMMSMLKLLSEERKEAIVEFLSNINTLVVPSVTILTPGFITQYAVLYVQFLVPQAHSYRALARERRQTERILFLKFWVIHGFATVIIDWAHTVFWIVPLKTHLTFIAWCIMVTPRLINGIYNEFDRELQAFHLLPPAVDDLNVENTHTARALSILYASLPKAEDVDRNLRENQSDLIDGDENTIDIVNGKDNTVTTSTSESADVHGKKDERAMCKEVEEKEEEPPVEGLKEKKDVAVKATGATIMMASKAGEDEGGKENLENQRVSSSSKIKPLVEKGISKADEEALVSSLTQTELGKEVPAKKTDAGETGRRRSNRLKQSAG